LIGYTSSDIILWSAAGADEGATGKFFNLRRFTPGRWGDPAGGGGQLSYWFEESLFTYIQEADLIRLRDSRLLPSTEEENPYERPILELLENESHQPWVALGWKQYLYWYANFERKVSGEEISPDSVLTNALDRWSELDQRNIFFDERQNDGAWLRPWRRALREA